MPFSVSDDKIEYVEDGAVLAEVLFPALDAETVDICHTFVDEKLRGQGIAGQLLEKAAGTLRETNRKAVPTCSYAVRWFQQHPEYGDVLKPRRP